MSKVEANDRTKDQGHRHNPQHNHHHGRSMSPSVHQHHTHHNRYRSLTPSAPRSNHDGYDKKDILVCHASAHAIVFRDHLRMARRIIQEEVDGEGEEDSDSGEDYDDRYDEKESREEEDYEGGSEAYEELQSVQNRIRPGITNANDIIKEINHLAHDLVPELDTVTLGLKNSKTGVSERNIQIEGLNAPIVPLDSLKWNMKTEFQELLDSSPSPTQDWSEAEIEVIEMLEKQQACVKTIQKNEWPVFLERFQTPVPNTGRGRAAQHADIPPDDTTTNQNTFNSFVTSTSLLPSGGKKMRCYGSELSYPVGVVFGLPTFNSPDAENQVITDQKVWAWPAGYAAKTEFNIDNRGELINGRQEALVSLEQIRKYNDEYLHAQDHYIAGRIIKGGFKVVPYNECFVRVGGPSRIVNGKDIASTSPSSTTTTTTPTTMNTSRSFDKGCGLFVALFIRTATMGDIIDLFRTKARIEKTLGQQYVKDIPLLYLHNEHGIRVFTKCMQRSFWTQASANLQPFGNPSWAIKTSLRDTSERSLQHKLIEQLDLKDDVDPSNDLTHHQLAKVAGGFGSTDSSFFALLRRQPDFKHVHDVMQQVFAAAIRANDYYTARQTLILYALANTSTSSNKDEVILDQLEGKPASTYTNLYVLTNKYEGKDLAKFPSPLATKRWRRATHNEGLLVVLGAAQILKTITVNSAERRTNEAIEAVDE